MEQAVLGTLLSIKPILHVDIEGRLIPMEKLVVENAPIQTLVEKVKETYNPNYQKMSLFHGDDLNRSNY